MRKRSGFGVQGSGKKQIAETVCHWFDQRQKRPFFIMRYILMALFLNPEP